MATTNLNRTTTLSWITDLMCFLAMTVGLALWVSTALQLRDARSPGPAVPNAHGGAEQVHHEQSRYI